MPIGSHRFYFGSLNEYAVDRLAENIGLCRGKLLGEDLHFDECQFLPHPDRYVAIVDPGGGNALVIGEGPLAWLCRLGRPTGDEQQAVEHVG